MSDQPTITTGLGVAIPTSQPKPTSRERPAIRFGKRAFRGFAVLDAAGNPVWGTLRGTEAEALKAYRTWNPSISGHPMGETVVPVTVTIDAPKSEK